MWKAFPGTEDVYLGNPIKIDIRELEAQRVYTRRTAGRVNVLDVFYNVLPHKNAFR